MITKEHLTLIRAHFGNPYPFWVDERDENGYFPASPTPESVAHPVSIVDGKIVEGKLDFTLNDVPATDAQYVAYTVCP